MSDLDYKTHLSCALDERLVLVMEECGEVTQACSKALRHGLDNYDPENPRVTNRMDLARELGDLQAAILLLADSGAVSMEDVKIRAAKKYANHKHGKTPLYHQGSSE